VSYFVGYFVENGILPRVLSLGYYHEEHWDIIIVVEAIGRSTGESDEARGGAIFCVRFTEIRNLSLRL